MKHRGIIQEKPRRRKFRADDDELGDLINIDYNGFVVSVIGQGDLFMWNAMNRQEKKMMVRDLKGLIKNGTMKSLDIIIPGDPPKSKVVYVPGSYSGTGQDFIKAYLNQKKK